MTKRAKTERGLPPGFIEVWITRDSNEHGVFDHVDVWNTRPQRYTDLDGAYWLADRDEDRIARVRLERAALRFRTLPDDDRQCVRLFTKGGS